MKITFLGDIMCLPPQDLASKKEDGTYDYNSIFDPIRDTLKQSDIVIANLETNFAGADMVYSFKRASFNTPDSFVSAIKKACIGVVTTSNNHCLDRGIEGLKRTLEILDQEGIKHTGTYRNQAESETILIVENQGMKIAVISATYGTNSEFNGYFLQPGEEYHVDLLRRQTPMGGHKKSLLWNIRKAVSSCVPRRVKDLIRKRKINPNDVSPIVDCVNFREIELNINQKYLERLKSKISKAADMADIVAVSLHIGGQYNDRVGEYTEYIMKEIQNTEADLIIGCHPHCVLPYELLHENRLQTYSLGNFCFTPNWGYWHDGVLAEYSVIIHAYYNVDERKFSRYTYSVVKNITDLAGNTSVYDTYDLIMQESSQEKREYLLDDLYAVIRRFMGGKDLKSIKPSKEYDIISGC